MSNWPDVEILEDELVRWRMQVNAAAADRLDALMMEAINEETPPPDADVWRVLA